MITARPGSDNISDLSLLVISLLTASNPLNISLPIIESSGKDYSLVWKVFLIFLNWASNNTGPASSLRRLKSRANFVHVEFGNFQLIIWHVRCKWRWWDGFLKRKLTPPLCRGDSTALKFSIRLTKFLSIISDFGRVCFWRLLESPCSRDLLFQNPIRLLSFDMMKI